MSNRTTPWLLLAAMTVGCAAHAGEPQTAETPAYFNGVKVAIDPTTGKLRQPTTAELQALRTAVAPSQQNMSIGKRMPQSKAESAKTLTRTKNGTLRVQLPESSMTSIVAVRQADGSLKIGDGDAAGNLNDTQEALK